MAMRLQRCWGDRDMAHTHTLAAETIPLIAISLAGARSRGEPGIPHKLRWSEQFGNPTDLLQTGTKLGLTLALYFHLFFQLSMYCISLWSRLSFKCYCQVFEVIVFRSSHFPVVLAKACDILARDSSGGLQKACWRIPHVHRSSQQLPIHSSVLFGSETTHQTWRDRKKPTQTAEDRVHWWILGILPN